MVPYAIPFLGSAIAYGIDPVKFMQENYEKVEKFHLLILFLVWKLLYIFNDGKKDGDFLVC